MSIVRGSSESNLAYHKRLIYGKLIDKTLSDSDYAELAEAIYGQKYSSDVARRMMYGSCKTLQLMEEEAEKAVPTDLLTELDMKRIEIRKEQQRFYDQRREFLKIVSQESRKEHIETELRDAALQLSQTVGQFYTEEMIDVSGKQEHAPSSSGTEAVLFFSDWHYGMKTANVFNTYNVSIFEQRLRAVVQKAIERISIHQCKRLHIVILGDMIHGAIHTSARVASEELVCDQLMKVSEILAQTIELLSNYVDETIVYTTYGNHARTVQSKSDNIHRDNMERVIPWWLEQRLTCRENVHVMKNDGSEFVFIDACGHQICAAHGDNDAVRSSSRLIPTLFGKMQGRNIEYIVLGDKHHSESFEELGVTSMMCGALCGSDDYSNDKRLYSTPSQLLLIVNTEDGVDAEYRVKC